MGQTTAVVNELTLPLTDEQTAMIEETLGVRVDEFVLSSDDDSSSADAGLRVLKIADVTFTSASDIAYVAN
jgi:hypothetical protein